jgi:acyl-coenzyme A thioesterase PaaI-like protein
MTDPDLTRQAGSVLAAVIAAVLEDAAPLAARLPAQGEAGVQTLLRVGEDLFLLTRAVAVLHRLAREPA